MRVRVAAAVAVTVIAFVVYTIAGQGPRLVPIALLVAVAILALGAAYDAMVEHGATWPELRPRVTTPGSDRALAAYVRLLESDATSASADTRLRDLLCRIADERLDRRRGLTRSDPGARELLGTDLLDLLDGPPRKVSRRQLDDHLRRIEAL